MYLSRFSIARSLAIHLALAAAYYATARLGLLLAFASTNVTPVWPPSGIAFAALLLLGMRRWPGILAGAFVANLVVFSANGALTGPAATFTSLAIAFGNTLEAVAGTYLLTKLLGKLPDLSNPTRIYCFAAVAGLMSMVGAVGGIASLTAAHVITSAAAGKIGIMWWLGDTAGIIVVTPFILAWSRRHCRWRWTAGSVMITVVSLLILAFMLELFFGRHYKWDRSYQQVAILLLPTIGWAAYRYGMRGVTIVVLLLSGAAVFGTTQGMGPFSVGTLDDALSSLEIFIALCSLMGMVLASDRETQLHHSVAEKAEDNKASRLEMLHWLVLFVCQALTILVWHYVASGTEQHAREMFQAEVDTIQHRVNVRMNTYAQVLKGGKALFRASPRVTDADWHAYVESLEVDKQYPGLQVLAVAEKVTDTRSLQRRMGKEGMETFKVWPDGGRDDYIPVVYIAPQSEQNARVLGFDLQSEPIRRAALTRAVETGEIATTGAILLMQDRGKSQHPGFLMALPVFRKDASVATPEQRTEALYGYVVAAFRTSDLMAAILSDFGAKVALEVFDGKSTSPENLIYSSLRRQELSLTDYPNPYSGVATAQIGDALWTLRVTSLPAFESVVDRGKALIVLVSGMLISLLFFSMTRALTANREEAIHSALAATRALRSSENKFGALVESAVGFSIISTDLEGVIQVFSSGAERMLGYVAEELVGLRTPAQLHVAAEAEARGVELSASLGRTITGFEVFVAYARMGRSETREWTYVRKDGGTLPVQLTVTPIIGDGGAVTGFLGMATDITARQQIERDLRTAKRTADAVSGAKSEFVANMSHELRTPLNAVLGIAELLDKSKLDAEQRKDLDMIRVSGKTLLGILNDILDFSKIEAGRMELSPEPFDLDELLATVGVVMGVNAGVHDLELVIDVDPAIPRWLEGDALRLQQLLVNLAGNAIKFTAAGSVRVYLRHIVRADGRVGLQIEVHDTGIGMTREQIGRVFAPFAQADSSMTRRFGGTGLGLAICRRLAELMGGSITVDSRYGAGSVFTISLDLDAVALREAKQAEPPTNKTMVLVASENPMTRLAMSHAVERLGWNFSIATEDDIGRLRSGIAVAPGLAADLVLLDWRVCAEVDPAVVIRCVRAGGPALVLMVMSCYARSHLGLHPSRLDVDMVLDSPVTAASLLDGVQRAKLGGAGSSDYQLTMPADLMMFEGSVLLVEDNEFNQYIARSMLAAHGLQVEVSGNGQLAIDLLQGRPGDFDLVLMDVQMPVMDGFAATRVIRQVLGLDLPVIAMTAGVMENQRNQCIAAGMNDFIGKPVDRQQMCAVLARYLTPQKRGEAGHRSVAPARDEGCNGIFDLAPLLDSIAATPESLHTMTRLLTQFVRSGTSDLEDARLAYDHGDRDAAARMLHTLRGSVGTLGAQRFAAVCQALETAMADDSPERIGAMFRTAREELEAVIAAADLWLAQSGAQAEGPGHEDCAVTVALLGVLLAEHNTAALSLYEQLRGVMPSLLGDERAQRLDSAMDLLDFDAALELLPS
ncbi:CHASE domain-containing protein [Duganella vulcania]|uniref:Virulence sensor protein BvgS n=1 Tax=Duganella vulcania TaxID=2692166 RepID=A0A845GRD1_9BURK|nr:CHASE domain-containing protein [Duganella vulcania]MYM95942.1 response regulator [Duganella vulcania]